jgi:hypothetical protein
MWRSVYAPVLETGVRKDMWVQVPPSVPFTRIRPPSELLQEVLDDALPVVLWDMHGE